MYVCSTILSQPDSSSLIYSNNETLRSHSIDYTTDQRKPVTHHAEDDGADGIDFSSGDFLIPA